MVVVESGVALDGLLLTQLLVRIFDTVNSSTGDLRGMEEGLAQGPLAQS